MKKSKLARLIAAICCFAMLLAACSSNQTPAESGGDGSTTADSEKKVLTYAIGAETTDLSTLYMNNSLCCTSKLVYENLVDFDNGEIVPGLAESWEYNDDQTELTFHLRQGVTFHNRVQKEFPGTESKSETESLLRKAMEDYETKMFLAQAKNITLGDMLDMWVEEELKPGSLSDGTVTAYINTVSRIKKHPIGKRKLKTVTSDHLQSYMDLLSFGGTSPDGKTVEALSKGSLGQYSAVLQNSFRFAVFPKRLITFNPMQYVVKRVKDDEYELFTEDGTGDLPVETPTISHEQYLALNELLKKKHNPALLPIQIAYYAGLRIGEVCGLTWQDIDLKEQCLTIRRSMRYDSVRKKTQIGPTKRKKIRTVDFCDTLAAILREAKKEQMLNSIKYGPLYSQNYYRIIKEKNRTYYEVYSLPRTETPPEDYTQVSFVCLRPDGAYEAPATVSSVCRYSRKKIGDMDDFHFHLLRHTYTTNLLSHGAAPKDVQELLGHSDVSTTMNIYAHATREAKRTSARLLDKVVGTA